MKKEQNSAMIIYVFYDLIRFMKELRDDLQAKGEDYHGVEQQIKGTQLYISLYLKTTLGEKEMQLFLHELEA